MSKRPHYTIIFFFLLLASQNLFGKKLLPYHDKLKEHYIAIWGGAGYSKLNYYTTEANLFGHAGATLGASFELHNNPKLFWSFGAELSFMNSGMKIKETMQDSSRIITDNDISPYTDFRLYATFKEFTEIQHFGFLSIPIMCGYKPSNLYFLGGVKFGINLYADHTSSTVLTTIGDYPTLIDPFRDMPNHGFYTDTKVSGHGLIKLGMNISISGEVGYYVSVNKHKNNDLRLSVFMDYGIINTNKSKSDKTQPTIELLTGTENTIRYKYQSILNTELSEDPTTIWHTGFKITYLFCIKSRWDCDCYIK